MEQQPQQRPGMPPIVPSGDPQPFNGGGPKADSSASNFAAEFLAAASGQQPQNPQNPQLQNPQPQNPQPQNPQPQNPQNPQPQVPPVVVPQPPQAPQPDVQAVSTVDRYSAQPPSDPLANLEHVADLEPVAEVQQPDNLGEKANYAFASLKSKYHAERKRAEELVAKYNALVDKTKGFVDEKAKFADVLNKKDSEIKQLQDDIGKIELSRSPAFREKYDAKLDAACAKVADVLERNGVAKEAAQEQAYGLLVASPEQLAESVANMPAMAQGEIGIIAREARGILSAREAELADWRKSQAGLEAVSAREGDIRYAQHVAEMADKGIAIIRSLAPDKGQVPAYAVTDPDFAAARDAKEAQFKDWLARAPEEQKFAAMLEGFMAPKTYEMLEQTMRENLALKQALAVRSGLANPKSVSVPYEPPPPPPPKKEQPNPALVHSVGDAQSFAAEFMRAMQP